VGARKPLSFGSPRGDISERRSDSPSLDDAASSMAE
jgi:hypothetical protein